MASPTARTTRSAAAPRTRSRTRRTSTGSPPRGSNGVLYSLGPGRAPSSELAHWAILGYRPEEFPGRAVFEAVGVGQEVSAEHVFAYAALRPADMRARRALADRPTALRRGRGGGSQARGVLRRARGRRPPLPACAHPAGRGSAADRGRRGRAPHRHRRVLPRPSSRAAAAGSGSRRRADGPGGGGVDTNGDRAARGRALQRDHAQVVGPSRCSAQLRGAPRPPGHLRGRVGLPARAGRLHRPGLDRGARGRRPRRRPAPARRPNRRAARSRRRLRLRPPEGDRRGGPHQGSGGQARHDRGARRRARQRLTPWHHAPSSPSPATTPPRPTPT